MTDEITFVKATIAHKEIIFSWLAEPHIQEFWDNTQAHKDDILDFMAGRKSPSNYCGGKYVYWIALASDQPYAMLMTIQETSQDDIGELKLSHLSKTGNTYGLDYMIGNAEYIGQGYGSKTLIEFVDFFRNTFDKRADTFLIDPASDNPRAKQAYEKAGFKHVADFVMGGDCSGTGKPHHLLIKRFASDACVDITPELAKNLIVTQFPEYADLVVTEVEQQGHDNRTYLSLIHI